MITVEELKAKFAVRDVAPYGSCIVIPGDQFDPDWEYFLGEEGYKCHMSDIDGKPVTLVKLKSAGKSEGELEVYRPYRQPPSPSLNPERRWKAEEDELIIALWNQKQHNVSEIHAELHKRFPNRTEDAVKCRITRLIKAGKIHGRWHKGEGKKKTEKTRRAGIEPAPLAPSPQAPPSTPSSTPVSFSINTTLTIQLSVNCNDRNAVANLFDIIEKMGLRKKEASS